MHHYYEQVKCTNCNFLWKLSSAWLHLSTWRLPAGSSVFCYCSERYSLNSILYKAAWKCVLHIQSMWWQLPSGIGKWNILCPEAQPLAPLQTHVFVCHWSPHLISSWVNFHFKSILALEWHILHGRICSSVFYDFWEGFCCPFGFLATSFNSTWVSLKAQAKK